MTSVKQEVEVPNLQREKQLTHAGSESDSGTERLQREVILAHAGDGYQSVQRPTRGALGLVDVPCMRNKIMARAKP